MASVATIEQQSWYPAVSSVMTQAGVPQDIWLATMISESGGVVSNTPTSDPDQAGNPGLSYGLFQLRIPGIGSGHSTASLLDPVQNATIAAGVMGPVEQASFRYGQSAQLQAVENAGWPGNLSENTARANVLADVDNQLEALGISGTPAATEQKATEKSTNWLTDAMSGIEHQTLIVIVIVALIWIGLTLVVVEAITGALNNKTVANVASVGAKAALI